jgi:NitT/TauT family transport system permease protein
MARQWRDRLVLATAFLLVWQGASQAFGTYWTSSPWLVLTRLATLAANGELWFHGRFTVAEAAAGFVLGAIPGCVAAMVLRRRPLLEACLEGVAAVGYAVPKTALIPLFILWFGVGPASKIALVASAIFFIVFYSTLRGVKSVDARQIAMARVLGATEPQIVRQIVWPSVVPYVFGGLRVALPYAIAGAIVGEIISSNRGLGYLTQYGAMDFDTTLTFTALVTVMAVVLTLDRVLLAVQSRLLRWQDGPQGQAGAVVVG